MIGPLDLHECHWFSHPRLIFWYEEKSTQALTFQYKVGRGEAAILGIPRVSHVAATMLPIIGRRLVSLAASRPDLGLPRA